MFPKAPWLDHLYNAIKFKCALRVQILLGITFVEMTIKKVR